MTVESFVPTSNKYYSGEEIPVAERMQVKPTPELSKICHKAKNLYNLANYLVRARFFFMQDVDNHLSKEWLNAIKRKLLNRPARFDSIAAITTKYLAIRQKYIEKLHSPSGKQGYKGIARRLNFKELWQLVRYTDAYMKLPAQTANQVLHRLMHDWTGFYEAMKEYRKDKKEMKWREFKEKWKGNPGIPGFKEKDGEMITEFTNQQCRIREGYLVFPKKSKYKYAPHWLPAIKVRIEGEFRRVRIVPKGSVYIIEIIYDRVVVDHGLNKDNVGAIDIGIRNIVAMVNNIGKEPIVVKGGVAKSINQFYNKERAKLMSIKDKQGHKEYWTKRLKKLDTKRYNKMNNCFHHLSKNIIQYCIDYNIGTLVIGYNYGWKQEVNIGKCNNQNFVSIPFWWFIKKIMYKAYLVGIDVILVCESYSSKCSFLDNEEIGWHKEYKGIRLDNKKKRGLFRAFDGRIIHSDVNGAYNIMKIAIKEAIKADEIEGVGLHPRRVNWYQ